MTAPARVIALAGLARSGKNSVADILVPLLDADRYAFAEPLKTMLTSVFGPHFHTGDRERVCPEAGVSYRSLMQTLGTEWGRNEVNPQLWVNLVAKRLQDGIGRHYRKPVKGQYTLVLTDCRFASEAEWVKSQGGLVVYVDRPLSQQVRSHRWASARGLATALGIRGLATKTHQSEADEAREYADIVITNDGSLTDLAGKAMKLAESIESGRW